MANIGPFLLAMSFIASVMMGVSILQDSVPPNDYGSVIFLAIALFNAGGAAFAWKELK